MSSESKPYTVTTDIPYLPNPHKAQHLDLYIPTTNPGPHPCIVYIHGGAFKFGDKNHDLLPKRLLSQHRSSSGQQEQRQQKRTPFAIASLNYRLSGDAIFPAAIQDCNAAVRHLRAHAESYNIDPTRFIAMGESAGAYMACMVGLSGPNRIGDFEHPDAEPTATSEVHGIIDFYGPTDFLQMDDHAPPDTTAGPHNAADSPESLFLGAQITTVPDLCRKANPLEYVTASSPPVLIAHGTEDKIVPFYSGVLLDEKLREMGRDVTFHPVEGVDHVFWGISDEQQKELDRVVDDWLEKRVAK